MYNVKKTYKYALILMGLLCLFGGVILFNIKNVSETKETNEFVSRNYEKVIPLAKTFYNEQLFNRWGRAEGVKSQENIRAMIVPHHILASNIIHKSFRSLNNKNFSKVVIIGPNHEDLGKDAVIIPNANTVYQVPNGKVVVNNQLLNSAGDIAKNNTEFFINEHSVGALIPYIDFYLPQAEILPILVSSYTNMSEVNKLVEFLTKLDNDTLVLFSIDFSHYLTEDLAFQKDSETISLIKQYNIESIMNLNSDHIDSPATLAISLLYQQKLNLNRKMIYHQISNDFLQIPQKETTTYFGFNFYE